MNNIKDIQHCWQLACGLGLPAAAATIGAITSSSGGMPGAFVGLGVGLMGAAGGVWQNIYASHHLDKISNKEAEHNRLFNHDLAKAVALSISSLLIPISQDETLPATEREAIGKIAKQSQTIWLKISESPAAIFQPLLDAEVANASFPPVDSGTFPVYGTRKMWLAVLISMADTCGEDVATNLPDSPHVCKALQVAVENCYKQFGYRFHNDIKHDFATKGQAYAAVNLRMMGELITIAREQEKRNDITNKAVEELTAAVLDQGKSVVGWIGEQGHDGQKRLTKLRPLTKWLKTVDVRLSGIEHKANDAIQRLKKLEKQGARTEQAVHFESSRIRTDLAKGSKATKSLRKPIVLGTVSTVVIIIVSSYFLLDGSAKQTGILLETKQEVLKSSDLGNRTVQKLDSIMSILGNIPELATEFSRSPVPLDESPIELATRIFVKNGTIDEDFLSQLSVKDRAWAFGDQNDLDLVNKLQTPMPVDFDENSIEDILDFMEFSGSFEFAPHEYGSWADIGISPNSEITIQMRNASTASVLSAVANILSSGYTDEFSMDWDVSGGLVHFGTSQVIAELKLKDANAAMLDASRIADAFERYGNMYTNPYFDGYRPQYIKGRRHLEKALAINRQLGRHNASITILTALVNIASYTGDYDDSIMFSERLIALFSKHELPSELASEYISIGRIKSYQSKYRDALDYFNTAYNLAEQEYDLYFMGLAKVAIGNTHLDLDSWDLALNNFKDSKLIGTSSADSWILARSIVGEGIVAAHKGRSDSTLVELEQTFGKLDREDLKLLANICQNDAGEWKQRDEARVASILLSWSLSMYKFLGEDDTVIELEKLMTFWSQSVDD